MTTPPKPVFIYSYEDRITAWAREVCVPGPASQEALEAFHTWQDSLRKAQEAARLAMLQTLRIPIRHAERESSPSRETVWVYWRSAQEGDVTPHWRRTHAWTQGSERRWGLPIDGPCALDPFWMPGCAKEEALPDTEEMRHWVGYVATHVEISRQRTQDDFPPFPGREPTSDEQFLVASKRLGLSAAATLNRALSKVIDSDRK